MFFSIDGGDGTGKSTQIESFCQWLRDEGHQVLACRDPGSTPLGDEIRELLLHRAELAIGRTSEMLLYMAVRAQLVNEVIRPALKAEKVVVSDRYLLANVAYQGYGGGLDVEMLWEVGRIATGGLMPDLTMVLDLPPHVAATRIRRALDRMERQGPNFHQRVREGFLTEARRQQGRIVIIDAAQPIECVQADLRLAAQRVLRKIAYGKVDIAAEEQDLYGLA